MIEFLANHGFHLGEFVIPWSVVIWIVIIAVGLLIIRAAITLIKIAIIVGIGFVIFLGVQFLFNNFQ